MVHRVAMRVARILSILAIAVLPAIHAVEAADAKKKVLVLGVDGLDPKLLEQFMGEGILPNFQSLAESGDFSPLQTSMPPLSPIAWSSFITGMDPGGHGIYDFIHRDAESIEPYLSMARATSSSKTITLGSWVIPLSGGEVENLRKGKAFWQILDDHDVPTTVFRMPANFPPAESDGKAFSGMGTPDIRGTPGTFSFYTDKPVPNARDISGGKVYMVRVDDNRVESKLHGPRNPYRRQPKKRVVNRGPAEYENPEMTVDFQVYLDPTEPVAKFVVGGESFILKEKEWSPWVPIEFVAIPALQSVSSIGRFYLQQVRPDFRLYVSPLQINPDDPAMPISTPEDWSHELCEELGYFYTQELPEDTKALSAGILSGREFWDQSQFVYGERRRALDHFLDDFDEGLLFFYFSSVDQGSHMLWRYADRDHPAFQADDMLLNGIRTLYQELDEVVGRAMQEVDDDTTFVVMSDHGFCPFYWGVNLNTWLLENGYVTLKDPSKQGKYPLFLNVDWSRTQAYALGLNGLYVNLEGRERQGIVKPEEYQKLLDRLENDLLELTDPRTGRRAVTLVVQSRRDFHGPYADDGPDIVVGYNWGYRSSWKSPLGEFPKEVFVDNDEAWSGDHSVDYRHVPGVLLTNRKITMQQPALYDLTVAILDEYGVEKSEDMIGTDCLETRQSQPATTARPDGAAGEDR